MFFEQIIDLNNNGSAEATEPVVRAFRVTDGSFYDTDGVANGQVTVQLNSHDLLGRDHAPGNYLMKATTSADKTVYPFAVTAVSQAQTLSGSLTDGISQLPGLSPTSR